MNDEANIVLSMELEQKVKDKIRWVVADCIQGYDTSSTEGMSAPQTYVINQQLFSMIANRLLTSEDFIRQLSTKIAERTVKLSGYSVN